MFLILQFPFADLRGLNAEQSGRTPRPDWNADDPGECFIRGFGRMSARNATGYKLLGERSYVEFDSAAAFPRQPEHRQEGWHRGVPLHPWFRRLYFDGAIGGRFEFGFKADEQAESELFDGHDDRRYDLGLVARTIADALIEVRSEDQSRDITRLEACGPRLGIAYLAATTLNAARHKFPAAETYGSTFSVGPPSVHLRVGRPVVEGPDRREIVDGAEDRLFQITMSRASRRNTVTVQLSAVDATETASERARRVLFAHLNSLLYAHSHLVSVMDGKEVAKARMGLRELTDRMLRRFADFNLIEADQDADPNFSAALRAFGQAYAGRVDELAERLEKLSQSAHEISKVGKVMSYGKSLFELITTTAVKASVEATTSIR